MGAAPVDLQEKELAVARRILSAAGTLREAAAQLRERFAPLRAAVVDPMDLRDELPAMRAGRRALFLATSDGHCWSVTPKSTGVQLFILTEE